MASLQFMRGACCCCCCLVSLSSSCSRCRRSSGSANIARPDSAKWDRDRLGSVDSTRPRRQAVELAALVQGSLQLTSILLRLVERGAAASVGCPFSLSTFSQLGLSSGAGVLNFAADGLAGCAGLRDLLF
eukprot:scaffold3036_cov414-Prasinococcus_capsulatus_cf.AAC.31